MLIRNSVSRPVPLSASPTPVGLRLGANGLTQDTFIRQATTPHVTRFGSAQFPPSSAPKTHTPEAAHPKARYERLANQIFATSGGIQVTGNQVLQYLLLNNAALEGQPGKEIWLSDYREKPVHTGNAYIAALAEEFGFNTTRAWNDFIGLDNEIGLFTNANAGITGSKNHPILNPDIVREFKIAHMPSSALQRLRDMAPSKESEAPGAVVSSDDQMRRRFQKALLDLPWGLYDQETINPKAAQDLLEREIYGLDEAKTIVVDALKAMAYSGESEGNVLLLVGPGGTGKTSIAEIIAKATGRRFQKISMAGSSDAHELKGHLPTYIGAIPGKVVQGLTEAGTMNPVLLIDEIDKIPDVRGTQGNPKDALLEVLDPDQNHKFGDHYLGTGVDLSKVLFVATANSLDGLPEHLLSRCTVIRVEGYTEDEKLEIARRHLIPRRLGKARIPANKVEFTDDGLRAIIRRYTREGGVRALDKRIREIAGKVAGVLLDDRHASLLINEQRVRGWLTNPMSEPENVAGQWKVGEASGLFYSAIGGGRMPIQVAFKPGRGNITLTGNIKDVMRESAQVVVSVAQSMFPENEKIKAFSEGTMDIHIHYPDAATPKDGPSAGISTFVSLYSAMTGKKVPQFIGLTGEIDLHGNVGAIGGLKEKISGGFAQGVTQFIIPEENREWLESAKAQNSSLSRLLKEVKTFPISNVQKLVEWIDRWNEPPRA